MENNIVVKADHVSKKFNIYRKDMQKIVSVLFGKDPSEIMYALDDISFELEAGERINIFGVVGSGRSTLANIITDITSPSKGKVSVKGKINAMLNPKAGFEMEFSCRDNVYMKANMVGLPKGKADEIMDEVLKFAELTDFADLPLKRAPKGAPPLLSLAVHLAADADILIVDEVFGGGGSYVKTKCEDRLRDYLQEHEDVAMIMITNHLQCAKSLCHRGIVLDEGKTVFDGQIVEAVEVFREVYKRVNSTLEKNTEEKK